MLSGLQKLPFWEPLYIALAQLSFGNQRNSFVDFCNQATHLLGWDIVAVVPNLTYISGALCILYRLCYNNDKLT